jgi:hypothetical protein
MKNSLLLIVGISLELLRASGLKRSSAIALLLSLLTLNAFAQPRMNMDLSQADWSLTLDPAAIWQHDALYLPPVDLSTLPLHPPTQGWDALFQQPDTTGIRLPATVEQYLWGRNGQTFGVAGNYTGVSWFAAKIFIPREWEGRRMVMHVSSVRFRAEVFVNRKLVGYDLVNSTPFDIDLSSGLMTGAENEIAFRITDPNGNFNWKDSQVYTWGEYNTNPSHGFGGITGPLSLEATDQLFVSTIFIRNKPDPKEIEVDITVDNQTETIAENQPLRLEISEARSGRILYSEATNLPPIPAGENTYTYSIKAPDVLLWSPDSPNLYHLNVSFAADRTSQRFGFRWFEVRTIAGDRQFYLNDQRIVLRSAISWGFWPDNGIFPTDEYARKQVMSAKQLGLNMLSFHRAIGQTNVMNAADELGLLIWEEPGGNQYAANRMTDNNLQSNFYLPYRNEKLARMIRRDRNHPSLILYNLHNERGANPQPTDYRQMQMAHTLDPTRQINYNSSNGDNPEVQPSTRFKLHLAPYDTTFYDLGWYDRHHAGGPGVYHDNLYRNSADYLRYTDNRSEIIYWGEEGAIGTPPRLELIRNNILQTKQFDGWEAADYLAWYDAYDRFLDEQGFRQAFPSVDALTVAMGNVAYYYQGRVIENIRINNTIDGYVVNGWESMKLENHSGIVDNYRNPKGDPELMARYNRPLLLSVKLNRKVLNRGDSTTVDVFIVNEKNIRGKYTLNVSVIDSSGRVTDYISRKVTLTGGSVYGENLLAGHTIAIQSAGYTTVEATLAIDRKNILRSDESSVFVVPIDDSVPPGGLAADLIRNNSKYLTLKGSDQVFAVRPNLSGVPARGQAADTTGLLQSYFRGMGIDMKSYVSGVPEGNYLLVGAFEPQQWGSNMSDIVDWVQKGGSLVVVDNPLRWAEYLADKEALDYRGHKELGRSWYGGNFFNRPHPVFDGLPVGVAFNWEYQCFATYNRRRLGLRLGSGETLVGCVSDHRHEVYSALSQINVGRGRILITTLDIPACLRAAVDDVAPVDADGMNEARGTFNSSADNPANIVGQQLLLNMIRVAVAR